MSDNEFELNDSNTLISPEEVTDVITIKSSSNLNKMLDNGKYDLFKSTIDLCTTLEDTDDLTVIVRNSSQFSGKKLLNRMLNNFLCCLATQSLDEEPSSQNDRYIKLAQNYVFWRENIHIKEEFINGVLRLFEGNVLPEYYNFNVPSPNIGHIRRFRLEDKSLEEQKLHRLGYEVRVKSDACHREINGFANPLWLPKSKLPSGYLYTYENR
jgi:hypothetical protein